MKGLERDLRNSNLLDLRRGSLKEVKDQIVERRGEIVAAIGGLVSGRFEGGFREMLAFLASNMFLIQYFVKNS